MKRDDFTLPLDLGNELIIDNFAGGGGTSTGLEAAFGRPVDIAINHDPEALAMHALNHPYTQHLCESVWDVNPIEVTNNRPVGLVWLSPDCKHFSRAKGGTPVAKHIRGLAWVGMRWVALTKPRCLLLENVEEFQTWGPVIVGADGKHYPDPARKGKTFNSFVRQLRQHGYAVDWRELRACDNGAPTIRKRLFLVARRDGLPIVFPEPTHGDPVSREVLAGLLAPYRTAAECIDFDVHAQSIFDRKKPLVYNTERRVAKGMWRHVLTNASPFIVGGGGRVAQPQTRTVHAPEETSTAKADLGVAPSIITPFVTGAGGPAYSGKPTAADRPLGTLTTENHRAVVSPLMVPLRGTSEAHLGGHSIEQPTTTISAGGTHHALVGAHLVTIGYGEREGQQPRAQTIKAPLGTVVAGGVKQALVAAHITKFRTGSSGSAMDKPMPTATANSFIKRPGGSAPLGIVAAHLMHLSHQGDDAGTTRIEPLPIAKDAHRSEQTLAATFFEQANGGFWEHNDGRAASDPLSTIASKGANQRLVTAYLVKCGSLEGTWAEPEDMLPNPSAKGITGVVQTVEVSVECLSPENRAKALKCAALLREHLPEHFPDVADLVLMQYDDVWWALVDITLRMLKARELFRGQSFPDSYIIHEIPDPKLLFKDGKQIVTDPRTVPRIPLSVTAQVRMVGNSVSPVQAKALAIANFGHERQFARTAA